MVMFLSRPSDSDDNFQVAGDVIDLKLAKNRNGQVGETKLTFLRDITHDSIYEELRRYSAASFAQQRSLLLLRDLRAWSRHGHPTGGEGTVIKAMARHPWQSASAAWQLIRETRRRRRGRRDVVGGTGRG